MKKLVVEYCELPSGIKKPLWRFWHNLMLKLDKDKSDLFMNYGYASKNGEFEHLKLKPEDEHNRYFIQLYYFVTRNHSFENSRVLEVGSGRGGGAAFLTKYKKPNEYVAMDISENTINFCNKHIKVPGLRFVTGEAEKIPFKEIEFDAVVNVESARCYNNIPKFFSEVHRVLKADGRFLFADMIKKEDVAGMKKMLTDAGFVILDETDIRENVVLALQHNSERNQMAINKKVPKFLRASFYEFAGVQGTDRYNQFHSTNMNYWSFTLKKA